jgi:hypothetical protein
MVSLAVVWLSLASCINSINQSVNSKISQLGNAIKTSLYKIFVVWCFDIFFYTAIARKSSGNFSLSVSTCNKMKIRRETPPRSNAIGSTDIKFVLCVFMENLFDSVRAFV